MYTGKKDDLVRDIESLLDKHILNNKEQKQLLKNFVLSTVLYNWEDPEPEEIIPLTEGLEEIRESLRMFKKYKYDLKITIFGSARTSEHHDLYKLAYEFAEKAVSCGYKIITGAGPGIMEAGNKGAGPQNSFGLALKLPFENASGVFIDYPQNVTMFKHFYSRKHTFYRESQAIVVLPGGFGTMDEIFQGLASIQTGKQNIVPFILLDHKEGEFWHGFDKWLKTHLVANNYIYEKDLAFYTLVDTGDEAINYIKHFYKNFYNYFALGEKLFFQLKIKLSEQQLGEVNSRINTKNMSEFIFVRERYFNNSNLYVYCSNHLNTADFIGIKKLIDVINTL